MHLFAHLVIFCAFAQSINALALGLDASVKAQCLYQSVDYYKQDMLFIPRTVPVFAASASVPRLIATEGPGKSSQCGSTVISDDCKILTGLHCLRRLVDEKTKKLRPLLVNGTWANVNVIAAGRPDQKTWAAMEANDLTKDWAVIQVNPALCGPCLKASSEYKKGEEVWAIGYPAETKSFKENSAGNSSMYFSPGQAYGSFEESPHAEQFRSFTTDPDLAVRERFSKMKLASVTATAGNSGGPLVNAKGEIVALSQSTTTVTVQGKIKNADDTGAMLFAPISEIQRQLGPAQTAEIFNCKGHGDTDGTDRFVPTLNL